MPTAAVSFPHIGTDESGKGDYFGPLVAAAILVDAAAAAELTADGLRDSKQLSDGRVRKLAGRVRGCCPVSVVAIGPEKYNDLYGRMRNLNRMLAWAHARAIENLLAQVDCPLVITDQFGDEAFVRSALMERGRKVELVQYPGAEADAAVAAASVVARDEFLKRLAALGEEIGLPLPKGAGPPVEEAALGVVRTHGPEALRRVAKLHFRTTARILARAGRA
ncbi:MAG TPA: ribonuclease HIII [Clostridiales bacterium]|nr:ribonuclease HIII [Clostridiales bacterium]